MRSREEIVAEARSWIGVQWRHQGRTRRGVDCAGLVILVARELGLSRFDTTDYGRHALGTRFLEYFKREMLMKPLADAAPGDVMLFRDKQFPCHSTVVAERDGSPTIVHAHALRRRVVEDRLDQGDWMERRVACFEFKGIKDGGQRWLF